jgi:hypothetical protein
MFVSTNFNGSFEQSQYYSIFGGGDGNFLDLLDSRIIKRFRSIRSWTPYSYEMGMNLPLLSYKYYNTTTLYWVIAVYNGIIDPFGIRHGTLIKIPDYTEITQALADIKSKKKQGVTDASSPVSTLTI